LGLRASVLDCWTELAEFGGLLDAVRRGVREVAVAGLPEAAAITLALAARRQLGRPLVLLAADWASAQAAADAAAAWLREQAPQGNPTPPEPVLFFPPRDFLPYAVVAQSPEVHARRLATLAALASDAALPVLVLPVSSLRRQLPPPQAFRDAMVRLKVGDRGDPRGLAMRLAAAGYERQALVERPGTFALRGGIVDVFPLTEEVPLRAEFVDDRLDSLRRFQAESQRSLEALPAAVLPPAREVPVPQGEACDVALRALEASRDQMCARLGQAQPEARQRLQEQVDEDLEALRQGTAPGRWEAYLPFAYPPTSVLTHLTAGRRPPLCVGLGARAIEDALSALRRQEDARLSDFLAEGRILPEQAEAFGQPQDWRVDLAGGAVVACDRLVHGGDTATLEERVDIPGRPAPSFSGQWTLALDALRRWEQGRYRVVCWTGSGERAARLQQSLEESGIAAVADPDGHLPLLPGRVHVGVDGIPGGFEMPALRLAVLGESELWGHRPRPTRVRRSSPGARLQSYEDLRVGDFVVHASHGIGQYLGTTSMTVQGKVRDYLVLRYEGTDRLYVPTDQVGLVQKYIGGEGRVPRLSRLGGAEWARTKQRVKESVRRMAEELIALYAARQSLPGHAYSTRGPWHEEFAATFPYEETPDQLQAIAEIEADMERPVPMDRLLCGDVGYGKTEVAMRAAFKAVCDGKQVAVLVPTTILAEQHYLTFSERFRGFPVGVRMLSRFRSRREQEETITALRRGAVDIVIGTHRLLQGDIDFRNLGLLIIDEEHRFGVAHKERLKQLRQTVDVLSMTATPIPRTMHMALAGIRDMSVINTPPENRFPVETVVVEWTPSLIREALHRELARGGQVYYLHNRVQSIGEAYERLRELVPDADIVIGHGQMAEDELERVMTEFWRGEHQILLATTIIESGLDIPNANTVIVEDADKLGLAQLYQIRGRVGRSSRVAYAYFTYRRERRVSQVAEQRLAAVKEFTELGSGFRIAMRDLEIRGAGNLLGPEQHGFVAAVGFELYAQLLEEAVRELRGERDVPETRATVELSVDAFLDDAYVAEPRVKLEFYKKVHQATSLEDVAAIEAELRDRFGPYPAGVEHLLRLARLRIAAQGLGLLAISQEGRTVTLSFPQYAASSLGPLVSALSGSLGRRLRAEVAPKPVLHLQLDATDDATVLASVESCLQALASHRDLRALAGQAVAAVAAPSAAGGLAAVAGEPGGRGARPAASARPGVAGAAAALSPSAEGGAHPPVRTGTGSRRDDSGPARRDRLAEAMGFARWPDEARATGTNGRPSQAGGRAAAPRPPHGARNGSTGPVRATLPPGLHVPRPAARPRPKA
jgi:transcription-repair coupling factor (superfamily II helicase)